MAYKITGKKWAKSISRSSSTRSLKSVKGIVIHYTGNKGDTAKNNVDYFAKSNTREAGAHFFISQNGDIWQSGKLKWSMWAVGGKGSGELKGKITNYNSVSIELCDNATKDPSSTQKAACKWLVSYIRKNCPNAKTICRHYDITTKSCPARMCGSSAKNAKWTAFKKYIGGGDDNASATTSSGKLSVDGKIGETSTKWWQRWLGTTKDGVISGQLEKWGKYQSAIYSIEHGSGGSEMVRALQKKLSVSVTGQLNKKTIKAWQKYLNTQIKAGLDADGSFGTATAKATQKFLNKKLG